MAIRIQHGDIADFARLGLLAGKAQADVRREQEVAQRTSQLLAQQATADRQRIALDSQRESQEFSAFIRTESQKRKQAWELEKIEIGARNRFELNEQALAIEFQAKEMSKVQKEQEKEQKIQSIRKALENGEIKENEANAAILTLQTGISQFATAALRTEKEEDPIKRFVRERLARMDDAPEEPEEEVSEQPATLESYVSSLRGILKNRLVDTATLREVETVIASGDIAQIKQARQIIEQTYPEGPKLSIMRAIIPAFAVADILSGTRQIKQLRKQIEEKQAALTVSSPDANALLELSKDADVSAEDKVKARRAIASNNPETMLRVKQEILESLQEDERRKRKRETSFFMRRTGRSREF